MTIKIKEQTRAVHNNKDDSHRHTEWKKIGTKDYIFYNPFIWNSRLGKTKWW